MKQETDSNFYKYLYLPKNNLFIFREKSDTLRRHIKEKQNKKFVGIYQKKEKDRLPTITHSMCLRNLIVLLLTPSNTICLSGLD